MRRAHHPHFASNGGHAPYNSSLRAKRGDDATVDLKLTGAYQHFFWSVSANNLLDALYYDYAIASTFTPGRFSAYPLPGRTFLVKAGATF